MFLIKVKFNFKYVSKMKGNCGTCKIEETQSSGRPEEGKDMRDLVQCGVWVCVCDGLTSC